MHDFIRQLLTEWRKLGFPFDDATVIVAISGGADSVGLALALSELKSRKKLNLRFVLAHFNHKLRGEESERDEEFVKNLAEKLNFELVTGASEISKNENLEQSARKARYEFLTGTAKNLKAFAVLTAHTMSDQAETFLMNLIRGSGLEGLGAMKIVRNLNDGESEIGNRKSEILLIRPLLSWAKRIDTENFCHLNEVDFRFDTMNEDLAFRRVRVRKVLLPMLQDFNPKIVENLSQTAFLLQKDFETLENYRGENAETAFSETEINLKSLRDLTGAERNNSIRNWLKNLRGDLRTLDARHFEAIERLIFSRKSGKIVELPGGEAVTKRAGNLYFEKRKVEK